MASNECHFISDWQVEGTVEEASAIITDTLSLPHPSQRRRYGGQMFGASGMVSLCHGGSGLRLRDRGISKFDDEVERHDCASSGEIRLAGMASNASLTVAVNICSGA